MLKYVLKVASLDENLIVKQKSRFLAHIFEYKESVEVAKFTQADPVKVALESPMMDVAAESDQIVGGISKL